MEALPEFCIIKCPLEFYQVLHAAAATPPTATQQRAATATTNANIAKPWRRKLRSIRERLARIEDILHDLHTYTLLDDVYLPPPGYSLRRVQELTQLRQRLHRRAIRILGKRW